MENSDLHSALLEWPEIVPDLKVTIRKIGGETWFDFEEPKIWESERSRVWIYNTANRRAVTVIMVDYENDPLDRAWLNVIYGGVLFYLNWQAVPLFQFRGKYDLLSDKRAKADRN